MERNGMESMANIMTQRERDANVVNGSQKPPKPAFLCLFLIFPKYIPIISYLTAFLSFSLSFLLPNWKDEDVDTNQKLSLSFDADKSPH